MGDLILYSSAVPRVTHQLILSSTGPNYVPTQIMSLKGYYEMKHQLTIHPTNFKILSLVDAIVKVRMLQVRPKHCYIFTF
jgi:hypothetical protein